MHRSPLTKTATLLLLAWALGLLGCAKRVAALPVAAPPPVAAAPPAPGIALSADRTTITVGQAVTLAWQSANATTVTINPAIGSVPANGNRQISPAATTTYTAAATGPGGSARSSALVITVNPAPAPRAAAAPAVSPPAVRVSGLTPDQAFAQTMTPILFDYDKANIRSDQESRLRSVAAWLKQTPGESFTIEGHADERGGQEYNIALGDERATATKKFLAAQGIAESRMHTVSFGEERPACRLQTEECWQTNRRAAFQRTH